MKNFEELPRLKDSVTYLYIEHAVIQQENMAIVAIKKEGRIPIPIASITCLLLGPGVNVTHSAIKSICENGCMAIWCGENMGRFYASGIGETRSAKNLLLQARSCMDSALHLKVAKRMYQLRFPEVPADELSLQQLRGMEGIRMRKVYQSAADSTGVTWNGRTYNVGNWNGMDAINRALSEANALLYGLCHAAIVSMGFSPGLGFVHTGKQLSFVYDVADLYKAETTIPAAFEAVKNNNVDLSKEVRLCCRKYFSSARILSKIPEDLETIFQDGVLENNANKINVGDLWDSASEVVSGGTNYSEK